MQLSTTETAPRMRSALRRATLDLDVRIGGRLRAARIASGITQEKLAEALGVTFQQIQKYEKGANRLSVSALIRVGQALEMAPMAIVPELGEGTEGAPPIVDPYTLEVARLMGELTLTQRRQLAETVAGLVDLAAKREG